MFEVITDINRIDNQQWDNLVRTSSVSSWFQSRHGYNFYATQPEYKQMVAAVTRDGILKGLALAEVGNKGNSLVRRMTRRAVITGGPLLADDIEDEELEALLNAIHSQLQPICIYTETRNFSDYSRWTPIFEKVGFKYEPHYNVLIDTSSAESVEKGLDRNRRRNIKKALENGVVVDTSPTEIKGFYDLLRQLYKTKVHRPLPDYSFFESLFHSDTAHYFIVNSPDGFMIGGLLCVGVPHETLYAWYCCGKDAEFRQLSPSVIANYAGIRYAAEHGFKKFDFMGAGRPDDGGYGVRDFKLKFGGNLVEYGHYEYTHHPLAYHFLTRILDIIRPN